MPSSRIAVFMPLFAFAVLVVMVGCGGSEKPKAEHETESGALQKEEARIRGLQSGLESEAEQIKDPVKRRYVEKANAACAQTDAEQTAIARQVFKGNVLHPTDAEMHTYLERIIPGFRDTITALEAVKPAPGAVGNLKKLIAQRKAALVAMERAFRHPHSKRADRAFARKSFLRNDQALAYGLGICGQED